MIQSTFHFDDLTLPVIATAIHSGHHMPDELLSISGISSADRLREEDPFTDRIAMRCSNFITVQSSRFMVDLNRNRNMAIYQKPEDCWGLAVRTQAIEASLLNELHRAYDNWYQVLDHYLQRFLDSHKTLIVFDLHSYNHHRGGKHAPFDAQAENPDLIIGRSNMSQTHYPVIKRLTDLINGSLLDGEAIDCRQDVKFSGGNLSRYLHSKYEGRVISISVEFKKIFMDEWDGVLNEDKFGKIIALFWEKASVWLHREFALTLW